MEFGPNHIFTQIYAPDNRRLLKVTRIIEWFWSLDDIGNSNIRYAILSHCQIMQFLVMQRCNKFQTGTDRSSRGLSATAEPAVSVTEQDERLSRERGQSHDLLVDGDVRTVSGRRAVAAAASARPPLSAKPRTVH